MDLRGWQISAFSSWLNNNLRGVIKVATGGGKTVFALHIANYCFKEKIIDRVVILVPSIALRDQWYVSLIEEGKFEAEDIHLSSSKKPIGQGSKISIAVINTARGIFSSLSDDRSLLIVDECHRVTGDQNIRALSGAYACTLGMSATPEGQYDDAFSEKVIPILGNVIFEYSIIDAIKDGILVNLDITNIKIDLLEHEKLEYNSITKKIIRLAKSKNQSSVEEIKKSLLRKRARLSSLCAMRIPVIVRLLDDYRGKRLIIFHEDVEQSNTILRLLKLRGHKATIYHSRISDRVRIDNLRLFRQGIFDIMICCRALDEGVNVPEIEVAIVGSSTSSERQRVQRLGRVLRLYQNKSLAEVVTLYAVDAEEKRLREEADRLKGLSNVKWRRIVSNG